MELLITTNISIVVGLCLILAFMNKILEKKDFNKKRVTIILGITLLIVNYIYYFEKNRFLSLLNILLFLGIILLIIISLILLILKKERYYIRFVVFGGLFLLGHFFLIFISFILISGF